MHYIGKLQRQFHIPVAYSSYPTKIFPTTILLQDDMKTSELCKTSGQVDVEILDLRSRILGLEVGYHVELPLPPSNGIQLLVDFDANVTKWGSGKCQTFDHYCWKST